MKNENERLLYEILNESYPGQWVSEHMGIPDRKYRFDCADPSHKIAIEIEGGIWLGKGHTGGLHYTQDMEKYNLATIEGWKLLRYSPAQLKKHPEQIVLDVMELTGIKPKKLPTKTIVRAKIAEKIVLGQVQVRLS